MKLRWLGVLGACALIGQLALAEEKAPSHPCKNIDSACRAAGYAPGLRGKRLWADCIKPILDGASLPEVKVEASDVATCKERREAQPHQ